MAMSSDDRQQARERQRRHRERDAAGLPVLYCGARTRAGTPCRRAAGAGTDHPGQGSCSRHGGATPTHRAAAARQQAMQEAAAADRELQVVDAGDVLELALAVANHRLEKVQERYGAQLDAGDLALVGVEGETLDRAARVAKLVIDLNIDWRRARIAEEQGRTLSEAANRALAAAVPDLTPEQRGLFVRTFSESLTENEPQPSALLSNGDTGNDDRPV